MCGRERIQTLETVIAPFGYCYDPQQDCFSTRIDAPQRRFGYTALYDRYAVRFGMVFDCLPVYFDYRENTWLIEFWKGQYGINAGCEAGIYKADGLVPSISRKTALFQSVEDGEMLPLSIELYYKEKPVCETCGRHWWLTMFCMGMYCEPRGMEMRAVVTFPNAEMLHAFAAALRGHEEVEYVVCGMQVQILFRACTSCRLSFFRKLRCRLTLWKNRLCCRLFLWVTRPFQCGMDRLLCLYFCLPCLIRRMLSNGKKERCSRKSCRKGRRCGRERKDERCDRERKDGSCGGKRKDERCGLKSCKSGGRCRGGDRR